MNASVDRLSLAIVARFVEMACLRPRTIEHEVIP